MKHVGNSIYLVKGMCVNCLIREIPRNEDYDCDVIVKDLTSKKIDCRDFINKNGGKMGKIISLNMAIGEKKLLTERIEKLTRVIEIVKAKGKKAEVVGGVAIKDVEIKLKSSYQQLTDLLDERDRLELAIVQKNAETIIEINGQKFTIAQALIRQKSIELKKEVLRRLRENYEKETIKIDQANILAEKEALAGINATNTAKGDLASNMKNAFDIIYDTKAMELLDPIGAVKEIEKLEKELLEFGSKLSYELTDINAITKIEY